MENPKIDVLSRPYLQRYDSGLNHVLAREAFNNNVAVELVFHDVLKSYLSLKNLMKSNHSIKESKKPFFGARLSYLFSL